MELTSVAVIEWQFSVSAVKVRLVIQKQTNKSKARMTADFLKEDQNTQKFLDERLFKRKPEDCKFSSREISSCWGKQTYKHHIAYLCVVCVLVCPNRRNCSTNTQTAHILSVLFVCLFARRRGNSSEICTSSCGVQTCNTLLTY